MKNEDLKKYNKLLYSGNKNQRKLLNILFKIYFTLRIGLKAIYKSPQRFVLKTYSILYKY